MAILVHEAAHGVLFSNRKLNDFIGQYILAAPYGGDMHAYRHYHLKHHKYAQSEKDPDIGLSAKFPVSKYSLRRKFLRDITGQTFLRIRLAQMSPDTENGIDGSDAFQKTSPWPTVIANLLIFVALANWGYWWAYFVLWALPLMTWFFAVLRLRNIAEHAMTTNDDNPLTHARTTQDDRQRSRRSDGNEAGLSRRLKGRHNSLGACHAQYNFNLNSHGDIYHRTGSRRTQ